MPSSNVSHFLFVFPRPAWGKNLNRHALLIDLVKVTYSLEIFNRTHQALLYFCDAPRVWTGKRFSDPHSRPTRTRENPNRGITSNSRQTSGFGKCKGFPTNQVNAYTLCTPHYGFYTYICFALEEFSHRACPIASDCQWSSLEWKYSPMHTLQYIGRSTRPSRLHVP